MKKTNSATKKNQYGFADLGISLLILAIGGTVAAASNHIEDKKLAAQQEKIVFEAKLGASTEPDPSAGPVDLESR